ncbi:MAG: FKBP-type peptidyl-prolyl cis-trans isomerase [Verrucomicrobiales bacterium]
MKHLPLLALATGIALAGQVHAADPAKNSKAPAAASAPAASTGDKSLSTQQQKASYSIGVNVGQRFKSEAITLDNDAFFKGFKDGVTGAKPALSPEETQQVMETFRKEVEAKTAVVAEKSKKSGEEFLAANKGKEGVKTLPSGLQYKVIKDGSGPLPKETDTVKVHYKGTLVDGTEFDSSIARNEPAVFPIKGVIPGWTEALQKMKVGSKWQLFIPPALAYGEEGAGPIPPNSPLIFEVELLGIEKAQ